MAKDEFDKLRDGLPVIFARKEIEKLLPGIISPRYLANLDSKGEGPPRIRIHGRGVAYPRDGFIDWLRRRSLAAEAAGSMWDRAHRRARQGGGE